MSVNDSISLWVEQLRNGQDDAARALWERCFPDLVRLARRRLVGQRDRMTDEEDLAASVLESFIQAAQNDRLQELRGRDSLWRLLSEMTRRKAVDYFRHQQRLKRGGGNVAGESAFGDLTSNLPGIDGVAGDDPTPDAVVILAEESQRLLDQLDEGLQALTLKKLEGYTNKEIAGELGCSVATVERRLRLIRKTWQSELT